MAIGKKSIERDRASRDSGAVATVSVIVVVVVREEGVYLTAPKTEQRQTVKNYECDRMQECPCLCECV